MQTAPVLVVGDDYADFGSLDGSITVSQLAALLDGKAGGDALPTCVIIGQGVSESWLNYLKSRVTARSPEIKFSDAKHVSERTGRSFAHKHRRQNILVTDPVQVSRTLYQCQLSVVDGCDITSDHITGYHLQGMLLIEAGRQTFLAVTERFLLENNEKHYFVINSMEARYLKFAFPVPTDIQFELLHIDRSRNDRLSIKAIIRFLQHGDCVTEVTVEYAAVQEARLHQRELAMAKASLQLALASLHKDASSLQEEALVN